MHLGIEKMQHRARATVYWPGIDADIVEYVKRCKICTQHKATQHIQPMLPRDVPEAPWQDLAADFFNFKGKEYLLIADTFSIYPLSAWYGGELRPNSPTYARFPNLLYTAELCI